MQREDIIYLAGILDGEGYFGAEKRKDAKGIWIRVIVGNTSKLLIDWLYNNFGGNVYKRNIKNPKHSQQWQWTISTKQAEKLLKLVYPFLIVKKEKAYWILKLRETVGNKSRLSNEIKYKREELLIKIRAA